MGDVCSKFLNQLPSPTVTLVLVTYSYAHFINGPVIFYFSVVCYLVGADYCYFYFCHAPELQHLLDMFWVLLSKVWFKSVIAGHYNQHSQPGAGQNL